MDAFVTLIPEDNDVSDRETTVKTILNKTYKRANTDPTKTVRFSIKRPQSVKSGNSITTDDEDINSQQDKKSQRSNNKSTKSKKSKNSNTKSEKRVSFALKKTKKTRKTSVISASSFNTDEDFEENVKPKQWQQIKPEESKVECKIPPLKVHEAQVTLESNTDCAIEEEITEKESKSQLSLVREKFSSKYKSPRGEP